MPVDWYWKQGDRQPPLTRTLENADGTPIDLTGATVRLHLRLPGAALPKVDAACTVVAPAVAGNVSYAPGATDTDTPGLYEGEFQVTFSDGTQLRIPNDSHLSILITGKLA